MRSYLNNGTSYTPLCMAPACDDPATQDVGSDVYCDYHAERFDVAPQEWGERLEVVNGKIVGQTSVRGPSRQFLIQQACLNVGERHRGHRTMRECLNIWTIGGTEVLPFFASCVVGEFKALVERFGGTVA